jgi:hypothetical protein
MSEIPNEMLRYPGYLQSLSSLLRDTFTLVYRPESV